MTAFWLISAAMVGLALATVLPVLLRKDAGESVQSQDLSVSLYQDKLRELDADRARGTLSDEQYDRGRRDVERALLEETGSVADTDSDESGGRWVAPAVVVALPLAAVVLYNLWGVGEEGITGSRMVANAASTPASRQASPAGSMQEMMQGLVHRLETNPEDAEGWALLGRTFYQLKEYEHATRAFQRSTALSQEDPEVLVDYADALAAMNNKQMSGRPAELIRMALEIAPDHPKALWLSGTAAYQAGDFGRAADQWQKLLVMLPEETPLAETIRDGIAEARQQAGQGVPEVQEVVASSRREAPATPGDTAIRGIVALDDSLMAQVKPDDTLFIFARAASGPRMPLAILRHQARDLPVAFKLDDSLAMMPAMKLSNFRDVVVGARISRSGNAIPESGDLEGIREGIKVGDAENIQVVINRQVP